MSEDIYSVVAVQSEVYAAENREGIRRNLVRCKELIDSAVLIYSSETGFPCKLVAFPEFFLQGWVPASEQGVEDWREKIIELPGPETDELGERAKANNCYLVGQAYTIEPEWPDRIFNETFIISPNGRIIYKRHKQQTTLPYEIATAPGDIYDEFTQKYGDSIDSFFPVATTELGGIGCYICGEGSFPEVARGLALNGAELLIRLGGWPEPWLSAPQDLWDIQNRVAASTNMCYLVGPVWGLHYGTALPNAFCPGGAHVVDYKGRFLARLQYGGEAYVGAEINMKELRMARRNRDRLNNIKQIRTEIFRKIYERTVWPANRLLNKSGIPRDYMAIGREVVTMRKDLFKEP